MSNDETEGEIGMNYLLGNRSIIANTCIFDYVVPRKFQIRHPVSVCQKKL